MRVALLHNPKPENVAANLPDDVYEEYDGAETLGAIAGALTELGVVVEPVVADRNLAFALAGGRYDFAFNIAEGWGRRNREAVPAAVCELLGIPYTGSDPLTLAVTLDKWIARRIVSPEVPVAAAVLAKTHGDLEGLAQLRYPAIVKPNDEGSSKGIRGDAVAESGSSAADLVQRLWDAYQCPVLVEEFLPGAEVTAGVMGNGETAEVLGLMEIEGGAPGERFVYSLEVKREFRRAVRYHVPPRLTAGVLARLEGLALRVYHTLGCRDVARIDFRLDAFGTPHFLECNPLPGLNPESGDLVILSRGVLSYNALVQGIFRNALGRNGMKVA